MFSINKQGEEALLYVTINNMGAFYIAEDDESCMFCNAGVDHYNEIKGISICEFLPPHLVIYVDMPAEEVQKKLKASGKVVRRKISAILSSSWHVVCLCERPFILSFSRHIVCLCERPSVM